MNDQTELETQVQEWLDDIKPVPPRNPQAATRGRAQFLGQAVSATAFRRHKGWISIFRKERFAMNMIVSILVLAGLLFGGGVTVNAAQDDLPNEPLYSLKTWSEDLSLQFHNNSTQRVTRLMELAQVRTQEMTRLSEAGQAIPDQTRLRLEQHVHQALQICSVMEDAELNSCLLQVRDSLQLQNRDMDRIQLHTPQDEQQAFTQTRTMLQQRLQLVEEGLFNHEMFRSAVRNGFRFGQEEEIIPPVQNGPGPQIGHPTGTPTGPNANPPGSSFGTGEPNRDPNGPNADSDGSQNNQVTPNPNNNGGPNQENGGPNRNNGGSDSDQGGNGPGGGGDSGGGGSGGGGTGGGTGGGGGGSGGN